MGSLEPFYASLPDQAQNTIPRLYISGDEDHLFLPFVVQSFLRDPLASIHIIEKCGHICNIERADEFNRVSLSFLNSYPNLTRLEHIPENTRAYRIKQKLQNSL